MQAIPPRSVTSAGWCGTGALLEQRWAFFGESRAQLRDLIPADKQASFDQSVEEGGYGFKNMTLKGMPLMFSLGGDPR